MSHSAVDFLQRSFAPVLSSRAILWATLLLAVALFAGANLPWHLDEYDQAKQAYVAYEISKGGDWLYQHTPRGDTATKPPLAGWISLALRAIGVPWDLAWRLPGFVIALVLLAMLLRAGREILPDGGATLAAAAFSLNLLTPRLATLVRTDMMLTFFIFVCGWMIHRKIRDGTAWKTGERIVFGAAMLAALLTKGPIIYAFLLPGMAAFLFLAPKGRKALVWSGWWTWVLPLAVFVIWGVNGLVNNREFYEDVVVREFFSRFDQSLKSHERQQPLWFYFPHLLHKFLPWSLLLIALPVASQNVRKAIRERPEVLWLVCWALGGLLLMTFVPSKRVDRIYPVVPPLCLLLVSFVAACQCGAKVRAWTGACVLAAVLFAGCYFAGIVWIGTLAHDDRLVNLGSSVRDIAGSRTFAMVDSRDEGMVLYTDAPEFLKPREAAELWKAGKIDALLAPERALPNLPEMPAPVLEASGKREPRYFLFLRTSQP